jgi:hypothetical protein
MRSARSDDGVMTCGGLVHRASDGGIFLGVQLEGDLVQLDAAHSADQPSAAGSSITSGAALQHALGFRVHDVRRPHVERRRGRADIGWKDRGQNG